MPPSHVTTIPPPLAPAEASASALAPLRHRTFRMLWMVWMIANVCMWMNDVASAWVMTSLTLVADDSSRSCRPASTLPVLLLGLPTGALADIVDRRKYLMFTQFWVAGVAVAAVR